VNGDLALARSGIADEHLQQVHKPERMGIPINSFARARIVAEPKLIARSRWLAGQVITLPHHVTVAFNRGEKRFATQHHRRRKLRRLCIILAGGNSALAIVFAVAVRDQRA
jgi:hypothetical protein